MGGLEIPKCQACGSWDLEETAQYVCALSGDKIKRYECKRCGCPLETVNGYTTPMDWHTLEWVENVVETK